MSPRRIDCCSLEEEQVVRAALMVVVAADDMDNSKIKESALGARVRIRISR